MSDRTKIRFNVLAIICILIFCFVITPITLQNDTYYTIKVGEHIAENGIDEMDPFSWHEDLPYTYPHWLYDVSTYYIYNIGGMSAIYIATVILSMILGITIYITNVKISKNYLTSFLLTLGVMWAMKGFIAARAQLVTFILFVLTLYFIEKFIDTKKKRYAIGLVIIPIIIANVHSAVWPFYFVIYLPYIAEYLLILIRDYHLVYRIEMIIINNIIKAQNKKNNKEKVEKLEQKKQKCIAKFETYKEKLRKINENPYRIKMEKKDNVKWLILIAIICLFTGLLTPIGDSAYMYTIKIMQGNTTGSINEHLPLVLSNHKLAIVSIVLFLAILIFTDAKVKLRDLFMISGLCALMFFSQRQFSMFVIIGVFVLNKLICSLFDKYDPDGTKKFIKLMTTISGRIVTLILIVLIAVVIFKDKVDDTIVDDASYPVEASKYIKENLNLDNIRLYNEYNYGSYLLFEEIPVFIDSRCDLYTPEFNNQDKDIFSDFMNISNINVYYEEQFEKYDITHVMMYKNAKLNLLLSKDDNYNELYNDGNFVIYERLK